MPDNNTAAVSALLTEISKISEAHSLKTAEASEIAARITASQSDLNRINGERASLVSQLASLQVTIDTLSPPVPDPESDGV